MNGIEAIYRAMKNPELEFSWSQKVRWVTYKELSDGEANMNLEMVIATNSYEVRKRETNLDKAVTLMEEYHSNEFKFDGGQSNTGSTIRTLLSPYIND